MAGTAGLHWWPSSDPALPRLRNYPQLPAAFNEQLASVQRAARAIPADPAAVRHLAHLYQANRLPAEAEACYIWLADTGGGLVPADHRLLAALAFNDGTAPRGRGELLILLRADPAYQPARLALADAFFEAGFMDLADAHYRLVLKRTPDQPQALLGLARVALRRRDDATAIKRLERLQLVHPEYAIGGSMLAEVVRRRGDTDRATLLAEGSRRKYNPLPVDPLLDALWVDSYEPGRLAWRILELMARGRHVDATPLVARLGQIEADHWVTHHWKGWAASQARHPQEAVAELRLALEKHGNAERILPRFASILEQLGRAPEAEAEVTRALLSRPDSIILLGLQSNLVAKRGGDARPLLESLLRREPYLSQPNIDLAKILWAANDRTGAIACLTRVTKAFPYDRPAYELLGQYEAENNNLAASAAALGRAAGQAKPGTAERAKLDAQVVAAHLKLGNDAWNARDWKGALDEFCFAAQCGPEGIAALDDFARESVQVGLFDYAISAYAWLVALQLENATFAIRLGDLFQRRYDAFRRAEDATAARQYWERALQFAAPDDTALRRALDQRLHGPMPPDLFP